MSTYTDHADLGHDDVTVHPFGDEWLWDESGENPLRFTSIEAAAKLANEYRAEAVADVAMPADYRRFAKTMWFTIERGDEDAGFVAEDGTLISSGIEDQIADRLRKYSGHRA